jgi:hypothetical protein
MKRIAFLICSGIGYLIGHYFGTGAVAAYSSILISYHLYLAYLVVSAEKETGLSLSVGQTIVTHAACVAMIIGLAMGRHSIPFFGIIRLFIPGIAPFEVTWLFSGGKKKQDRVEGQLAAVVAGVPIAPAASLLTAPAVTAPAMTESPVTLPAASPVAASAMTETPVTLPVASPVAAPVITETTATVPATPTASVTAPPMAGYTTTNTYSATTDSGMKASSSTTSSESDSTGDPYEDFILHMQSGKRPFRKPGITVKQEFELWLAHRTKTHQAALSVGARTKAQA